MAYLSFLSETDEDARAAVKSAATGDAHTPLIQAEFSMTGEAWKKVADALGELAAREGSELRTDFPGGWTLFWKIREGDSRFFVAHPENEQWVGTLALSESHLALARKFLENKNAGSLSALERVSRMSNLEVRVEFVKA